MRNIQLERLAEMRTHLMGKRVSVHNSYGHLYDGVVVCVIPLWALLNETQVFLWTGKLGDDKDFAKLSGLGARSARAVLLLEDGTFKIEFIKNLK